MNILRKLAVILVALGPVTIDIKPGSNPNCFNINGHGVIKEAPLRRGFSICAFDENLLGYVASEPDA